MIYVYFCFLQWTEFLKVGLCLIHLRIHPNFWSFAVVILIIHPSAQKML